MINNIKSYDKFLNESVRDLMKPKSEEQIEKDMGKERYYIYKSLNDAKDSIKLPYITSKLIFETDMYGKSLRFFEVKIRFLRFNVSYDGDLWSLNYNYNGEYTDHCNTWNETWGKTIEVTNQFFNEEISILTKQINMHQKNVDEIKELLSKI